MKTIPLTQGKVALIDDEDFEAVSRHKWCISKGYASARINRKMVSLHRFILKPHEKMEVDHKNLNRLDCRRENLRLCTRSQNMANRRIQTNNRSGFKGVYTDKSDGRFRAYVRLDGKKIMLGSFKTAELAAHAYDQKARELYGEFARTNF